MASNHLSVVDSIYLPLMLERPVTFAAKSEYFTGTRLRDRAVGAYLRATNQLSTDRAGARAAQEMLEAALDLLRAGQLFGIYPEGTRSPDGRLYRGRTGVGFLALHSGAPVIPVAMVGTERILPPGHQVPRPGKIEIRIGEPLEFAEFRGQPAGPGSGALSPTKSCRPSRSCPVRNTCRSTPRHAKRNSPQRRRIADASRASPARR